MKEIAKKRKGFFLTFHQIETILMLPSEQQEKLLFACYAYHKGDDYDLSDSKVAFAFNSFKPKFDAAIEHYQSVCEARSGAIKERWKKTKEKQTDTNELQNDTNVFKCNSPEHQVQVQVQDNINTPLTPQGGESVSTGKKKRSNRNAEYSDDFLAFWNIYPRKDNKRGAWKAYLKAQNEGRLPADLLERLRNKCLCDQWSKDGGKYIPYAERWLNKDGWEDADCEIESYAAGWEEELAKLGEIYRRCEVGIFDSEEERARKEEIYKTEYEPMWADMRRRGCRAI